MRVRLSQPSQLAVGAYALFCAGLLAPQCAGALDAETRPDTAEQGSRSLEPRSGKDSQEPSARAGLESEILGVLAEATEIATKTRMNADYVPGIVTVLRREEMLALGLRTVADALTLVPGLDTNIDASGRFQLAYRGLDDADQEVKVLIDSVPLSITATGSLVIYELPTAQVRRIEVIRGPGSALYGESAFAGLINIITADEPGVSLRHGDHGTTELNGIYRFEDPERDLSVRLNLSAWDSRGADLWVGSDSLHGVGLADLSNAPGSVDSGARYRFAQLKADAGKASLYAQYQFSHKDPFFGLNGVLPGPSSSDQGLDTEQWVVQGQVRFTPAQHLDGAVTLRWLQRQAYLDERVRPFGAPAFPGTPSLPDGLDAERLISAERAEAEAYLEWSGWTRHRWRAEISIAQDRVLDAWRAYNVDIETGEQLAEKVRYTGEYAPLDPDAKRTIRSVVLQDQWSIHPDFDLTLGARHDSYSDVSDSFSPRLAGVWRINDNHVLKAQIAGAFFPPSLFQRTKNALPPSDQERPEDPQRIRTTEISYVYRRPETVARVTLYYSKLFDLLVDTAGGTINRGEERMQGVELEWEQRFGRDLRVAANLSYADTLNRETDGPMAGAAKWLGNLAFFYYPRTDLLLAGRWRYVGDRARDPLDSRDDPLNGYNDLSLTLSWFNAGARGVTLRAGVTNLLSASMRSPAPMDTYEDDYPFSENRALWLQIGYALP